MFTFKSQDYDPIFYIGNKGVFTTYEKNEKIRIKPFRNTAKYLDSDDFRERYELSVNEGTVLKNALQKDTVPEGKLKSKFYHIRRDLNSRLFTEIDLRGTPHTIQWKFPEKTKEWPAGNTIIIGSSGVGKTHLCVEEVTEALKRPKKRKFVYVSPELNVDLTLKKLLNNKRWNPKYFEGIDVSDESFEEWRTDNEGVGTLESWWTMIKKNLLSQQPGTQIYIDDGKDSPIAHQLMMFLNKGLRTGRHRKHGFSSIQHATRGGRWTSQSFSSVKRTILFPRGSGKNKIIEFLYEMGIRRKRAQRLVEIFSETGRSMTVHMFSPNVIWNEKYAVWI